MDRFRIKERRKKLGLTLQEVADKLGLTKATVQKYESGYIKDVDTERLEQLANALDTTPAYLMGWSKTADDNINKDKINKMVWDENDEQNSSVTLSNKEITHIKLYRKLNDLGKKRVDDYMNDISEVSGYLYNEEDNRSTPYIAAHDGKIKKSKKISLKTAKKLNNQ